MEELPDFIDPEELVAELKTAIAKLNDIPDYGCRVYSPYRNHMFPGGQLLDVKQIRYVYSTPERRDDFTKALDKLLDAFVRISSQINQNVWLITHEGNTYLHNADTVLLLGERLPKIQHGKRSADSNEIVWTPETGLKIRYATCIVGEENDHGIYRKGFYGQNLKVLLARMEADENLVTTSHRPIDDTVDLQMSFMGSVPASKDPLFGPDRRVKRDEALMALFLSSENKLPLANLKDLVKHTASELDYKGRVVYYCFMNSTIGFKFGNYYVKYTLVRKTPPVPATQAKTPKLDVRKFKEAKEAGSPIVVSYKLPTRAFDAKLTLVVAKDLHERDQITADTVRPRAAWEALLKTRVTVQGIVDTIFTLVRLVCKGLDFDGYIFYHYVRPGLYVVHIGDSCLKIELSKIKRDAD